MSVRYLKWPRVGPEEVLLYITTFRRSEPSTSLLVIGKAMISKPYARGSVLFCLKQDGIIVAQCQQNSTGRIEIIVCVDRSPTMESTFRLTAQLVGARRRVWVEDPLVTVMEQKR